MIITLKDGSKKEYAEKKSVYDIALDISEGLARAACAGEVNGEVVDLRTIVEDDCELNILTAKDEKGLAALFIHAFSSGVMNVRSFAPLIKRKYTIAVAQIPPNIPIFHFRLLL